MKNGEINDIVYIDHILHYISDVEMILRSGQKDRISELAIVRAIEVIGEAANHISEKLRLKNSDIPWRKIVNMRNMLIHGYFEIDIDEVWSTCEEDIPVLKEKITKIKKDLENAN